MIFYSLCLAIQTVVEEFFNWFKEIEHFFHIGREKVVRNCTGKACPIQHGFIDPATCSIADRCPNATKPMTNGERVRKMSDERLVRLIMNRSCVGDFANCNQDCEKCWLEWFKKEEK